MAAEDADKERLYLLEFILDQVSLGFATKQDLSCVGKGQTCVSFTFLGNGPFNVCEDDFLPMQRAYVDDGCCTGNGSVKNGKSCMFSLTPNEAEKIAPRFVIPVQIFRRMPEKQIPDKVLIGKTTIRAMQIFRDLMAKVAAGEQTIYANTLKDVYKITSISTDETVGHLSCYIRLSYFGKMIINHFSLNSTDKSIAYKADQGHYNFKYNKKGDDHKEPTSCPAPCCPAPNPQCPPPPCPACPPKPCPPPACPPKPCPPKPCPPSKKAKSACCK